MEEREDTGKSGKTRLPEARPRHKLLPAGEAYHTPRAVRLVLMRLPYVRDIFHIHSWCPRGGGGGGGVCLDIDSRGRRGAGFYLQAATKTL